MRRIYYTERINKVGWFGIPYTVLKIRTANVDARHWQRLRGKPFSLEALLGGYGGTAASSNGKLFTNV